MFPGILDMENADRTHFFFQKSTKDRIINFDISNQCLRPG